MIFSVSQGCIEISIRNDGLLVSFDFVQGRTGKAFIARLENGVRGMEEINAIDCAADNSAYKIEELITTYGNDILRIAYLYISDLHAAEDIFQETFIRANQSISLFRGESNIKTWLVRITINLCKDYLKSAYQRRVVPAQEFLEQVWQEDGLTELERKETKESVRAAVMKLPDYYKEVVLCVYFQEMSLKETSFALHIAEGTVKSRLKRAREHLKKSLEGKL